MITTLDKMKKAVNAKEDQNMRYASYAAFDDEKYYILKVYDVIKKLNKNYGFKKVLDVGCADGSFSEKLKDDFGFDMHGVDVSKKAIASANKRGVTAKVHNLENPLPYSDNSFDLVVACEVIEHLYDTDFFLSEMKRVLKDDAFLMLSTPNLVSLVNRFKVLFGMYPSFVPEYKVGGAGHIRAYTVPILKRQLKDHQLKSVLVVSPNITFPMANKKIPSFLKKLAIRLGDFFPNIGSHMIIVSKKTKR